MISKEPVYYVNGKYLPAGRSVISVKDLGLLRGYGVFDFLVTYNKRPFLINQHVDRLFNSAKLIGLNVSYSKDKIVSIISTLLKKNYNGREKSIRIVLTGGISTDSITPANKSTLVILIADRHYLPVEYYSNGVKVITFDYERQLPQAKSLNYTYAVKATLFAKSKNAVEAIYISRSKDEVFEGTTSNLFVVKGNYILTPVENTLPGITRDLVISLIKKEHHLNAGKVSLSDLENADEIFISASNKEILPVVKVDNRKIGNGKPGKVTLSLIKAYKDFVESGNW